jgi:RNA polymerase sigma-70 factor (ECF subfamily)
LFFVTRQAAVELVGSLYESYYSALVRYAWRATGSVESAEELVQQAFLDLYEALQRERTIVNPMAWTFTAVRNAVRRGLRQHMQHPVTSASPDLLDTMPAPAQPNAGGAADELTRLFHLLSRREEEVLLLRLASLKYEEIAAELGINVKTVSALLSRAMDKMRKALLAGKTPAVSGSVEAHEKPHPRTLQ